MDERAGCGLRAGDRPTLGRATPTASSFTRADHPEPSCYLHWAIEVVVTETPVFERFVFVVSAVPGHLLFIRPAVEVLVTLRLILGSRTLRPHNGLSADATV